MSIVKGTLRWSVELDEDSRERVMWFNAASLPAIQAKLEGLRKKAVKLGLDPSTVDATQVATRVRRYHEDVEGYALAWPVDVKQVGLLPVEAPPVRMAGWTFLGVLDHKEGLRRMVPGASCPAEALPADDKRCDHCGVRRKRNKTCIVEHDDGRVLVVGATCVADFVGSRDAAGLLARLSFLSGLPGALEAAAAGGGGLGYPSETADLVSALVYAAHDTKVHGFVRSSESGSTRGFVSEQLWPGKNTERVKPGRDAIDLAQRTLQWIADLSATELANDYLYNLSVIANNGYVTRRSLGLLASAPQAYLRAKGEEAKPKGKPTCYRHAQVPQGERAYFGKFTCERMHTFEGRFGFTTVVTFVEADAIEPVRLAWFASRKPSCEPGDVVRVTGTVKRHETSHGSPQTLVNRCKVEPAK